MWAAVNTSPSFSAETPTELFEVGVRLGRRNGGIQDLSPDGPRFLALVPLGDLDTPEEASASITVVLNWRQELLERVPIDCRVNGTAGRSVICAE